MGERKEDKKVVINLQKGTLWLDRENWRAEFEEWNEKNNNILNKLLSTGEMVRVYDWQYITKDRLLELESAVKQFFKIVSAKNLPRICEVKDTIVPLCNNRIDLVKKILSINFSPYKNGEKWIANLMSCTRCILEQPKKIIEIIENTPDNLTKEQRIVRQYYSFQSDLPQYRFDISYRIGCRNLPGLVSTELATNENRRPLLNLFIFLEKFIDILQDCKRYNFDLIKSKYFTSFFFSMMKFRDYYRMAYGDFVSPNIDKIRQEMFSPIKKESEIEIKPVEKGTHNKKEFLKKIEEILYEMFPYELETQLNEFKEALLGQKKPGFVEVKYVGTKESLYRHLGKLLNAGISRGDIAAVFSEKCKWKKNNTSKEEPLRYEYLYPKIRK